MVNLKNRQRISKKKTRGQHPAGGWTSSWTMSVITAMGILFMLWKQTILILSESSGDAVAVHVADVFAPLTTTNNTQLAPLLSSSDDGKEKNKGGTSSTASRIILSAKNQPTQQQATKIREVDEESPLTPILWNRETRKRVLQQWAPDLKNGGVSSNLSTTTTNTGGTRIRSVRIGQGNFNGTIEDGGRLVVSITNDFEITSWSQGRQGKLCTLLRDMTLKDSLDDEELSSDDVSLPTPLINHTIDCEYVHREFHQGQGNWVTVLYIARMKAAKARVDYQFQCSTGRKSERQLIMPWLEGYFPHRHHPNEWPYGGDDGATPPTEDNVCPFGYFQVHLEQYHLTIQNELRSMAVEMMGPRAPEHEAYVGRTNAPSRPPLYPDLILDDVVIHFRCGDLFGQTNLDIYGVWQFREYVNWIRSSEPSSPQSIGILTQPFEKERNRLVDVDTVDECRQATHAMVDVLKEHYPNADIRIHNGPNETMPLAYARLIMAKQSFTTTSTFGLFPIIATFGDGYFQKGAINHFASPIAQYLPNVHEIQGQYLSSKQIGKLGLNTTLEWLTRNIPSYF